MLRQSHYLSGDSFKPHTPSKPPRTHIHGVDLQALRDISLSKGTNCENYADHRFQEIKKKYSSKERNIHESSYQSSAFKDITLRTSNYNSQKSTYLDHMQKSHETSSASNSPECFLYRDVAKRNEVRDSGVSRFQESTCVPKFGGRNTRLDTSSVAKSIEVS